MNRMVDYLKKQSGFSLLTYVFILVVTVKYLDNILVVFNKGVGAFMPLFVGIGIAYVLNIPMMWIENHLKKRMKKGIRGSAIVLTYILAIVIIGIMLSLIVPQLIETVGNLLSRSDDFEKMYLQVAIFIKNAIGIDVPVNFSGLYDALGNQMEVIVNNLITSVASIANGSVTFFISLVVSIYLLAGKERMQHQMKKLLGAICGVEHGNKVLMFLGKVNSIFNNYISGLLMDAVIIGSMVMLMMTLLDLPYAILVGVITTVLAIIPIFGNIMAMIIGTVFIFAVSPIQTLYFIIGYQVVQQLENNLIYPRVVGSSVGLPGLWTMLAVSVSGSLFGFAGMLVAVPVTSTIYMILSEFANDRLRKMEITVGEQFAQEIITERE